MNKIGCLVNFRSIPKPKEDAKDPLHSIDTSLTILNSLYKDNLKLNSLAIRLGQLRVSNDLNLSLLIKKMIGQIYVKINL